MMSLPPHLYPCVVQPVSSLADCHPIYITGYKHYEQLQFSKAQQCFQQCLETTLTPSESSNTPAISTTTTTTTSTNDADKPENEERKEPHSDEDHQHQVTSPGRVVNPSDPSDVIDVVDVGCSSIPRIHLDELSSSQLMSRPISSSHSCHDYSHLPQSHRSLLAAYHNAIACCLLHQQYYREAKQHLYSSMDYMPEESLYCFNLATLHHQRQQYDLAIKSYRMAIKRQGSNISYHSNLGLSYAAMGEFNKALGCWATAVEMNNDNSKAYANLAHGCSLKQKWKEAIMYLKQAIQLEKKQQANLLKYQQQHSTHSKSQLSNSCSADLLSHYYTELAYYSEQTQAYSACIHFGSLALINSPSSFIISIHSYRHRAIAFSAQRCYALATVDAQKALQLITSSTNTTISTSIPAILSELSAAMPLWTELLTSETAEREAIQILDGLQSSTHSSTNTIPLTQHQQEIELLHKHYQQQLSIQNPLPVEATVSPPAAVAATTSTDSAPPTPRTVQKQERILCVVCLDAPRSQLFEPCKHLLCCEMCSNLVRKCPFCKVHIKKRRGPIYM